MNTPFDVPLSLRIDVCEWELQQLAGKRGLRAMLRRWRINRRLRKLARMIPHA